MGKSHWTYYEYAAKNQNLIQLVRVGAKQVDNRPWQNIYTPPLKFELIFAWRGEGVQQQDGRETRHRVSGVYKHLQQNENAFS
jgi:hypothetical protein